MYHHTAPINMTYALNEALAIVLEEGLDARIARHAPRLISACAPDWKRWGFPTFPNSCTLNCIGIPAGADDLKVRRRLLDEYGIEIGAGLGVMAGKAWRIGLMGARGHHPQRGPCPDRTARGFEVGVGLGRTPRSALHGPLSNVWPRSCPA